MKNIIRVSVVLFFVMSVAGWSLAGSDHIPFTTATVVDKSSFGEEIGMGKHDLSAVKTIKLFRGKIVLLFENNGLLEVFNIYRGENDPSTVQSAEEMTAVMENTDDKLDEIDNDLRKIKINGFEDMYGRFLVKSLKLPEDSPERFSIEAEMASLRESILNLREQKNDGGVLGYFVSVDLANRAAFALEIPVESIIKPETVNFGIEEILELFRNSAMNLENDAGDPGSYYRLNDWYEMLLRNENLAGDAQQQEIETWKAWYEIRKPDPIVYEQNRQFKEKRV